MNMRKIDISSLIESIENSFMDNGVFLKWSMFPQKKCWMK